MEKTQTKTKKTIRSIFNFFVFNIGIILPFFLLISAASAASLYPSPSSGSYNIGQTFTVTIYISSPDQEMNAISGSLNFPTDKLEVTSLSKTSSVVTLWVEEPSYSNSQGTVSFEGIVLNPGYKGAAGKVLSVGFKTKSSGSADVKFSSGSVLANDGQGTNILNGLGTARFAIEVPTTGPAAPEAETPSESVGTPAAPQVTSVTHPDPDSWYANSTAEFAWALPGGTTADRLLVNSQPQATPTVTYVPASGYKKLTDLDDGVWYFHVRLRNAAGWGSINHFRFQIDTQDPEHFTMEKMEETDSNAPTRIYNFDATDATSGIAYYAIQIDDGEAINWEDDGSHSYETPPLGPGRHTIIVNALDKAGNFLTNFDEFTIEPLAAPIITDYPTELTNKDPFVVKGTTYPEAQVVIWLQREATDPENYIVKSDENGKFTFVAEEKLRDGIYQLWAEVIDSRGARSQTTEKFKVLVQPTALWRVGTMTANILSIIIPLIALVFLLAAVVWYSWMRFKSLRYRVGREVGEAETVLHKEFRSLKKRLSTHLNRLEKTGKKRKLTKEEEKIIVQLKKELDTVEERIGKEIKDIKKEVK